MPTDAFETVTSKKLDQVSLNGISFIDSTVEQAIEHLGQRALEGQGGSSYFVNVHTWTLAQEDIAFRGILQSASYCFPDGKPLVWLAHARGNTSLSRICGPDFTYLFLKRWGNRLNWACVGGNPGQALELGRRFDVKITEFVTPFRPFSPINAEEDWLQLINKFQSEQRAEEGKSSSGTFPNVVLVCLGAPKQEQWINEIMKIAPKSVLFLGVGAALDFLTGTKNRAPRWMQNSGLEWLHRLMSEPSRLGLRYIESNLKFLKYASRK